MILGYLLVYDICVSDPKLGRRKLNNAFSVALPIHYPLDHNSVVCFCSCGKLVVNKLLSTYIWFRHLRLYSFSTSAAHIVLVSSPVYFPFTISMDWPSIKNSMVFTVKCLVVNFFYKMVLIYWNSMNNWNPKYCLKNFIFIAILAYFSRYFQ